MKDWRFQRLQRLCWTRQSNVQQFSCGGHVPLPGRHGQVRHRDRDPNQLPGELRSVRHSRTCLDTNCPTDH